MYSTLFGSNKLIASPFLIPLASNIEAVRFTAAAKSAYENRRPSASERRKVFAGAFSTRCSSSWRKLFGVSCAINEVVSIAVMQVIIAEARVGTHRSTNAEGAAEGSQGRRRPWIRHQQPRALKGDRAVNDCWFGSSSPVHPVRGGMFIARGATPPAPSKERKSSRA